MSRALKRSQPLWLASGIALAIGAACTQQPVDEPLPQPPGAGKWTLTWSDEFDGPANSAPDPTRWGRDLGGGGWGNEQLEYNTDDLANAHLDGSGNLVMTALREQRGSSDYTSARLRTSGRLDQTYGRFEARMQLPTGNGLWPAFWLLGSDIRQVGWPGCGELDVMELRGSEPDKIHGSAHGPGYSGANPRTASYSLSRGDFNDGFHVFAIEWSPGEVHWFVDGVHYHAITEATMGAVRWVFDGDMFVILDLAVGGTFGGDVDDSVFPQSMKVDYVRVYKATP